jgi:hypothetical protein
MLFAVFLYFLIGLLVALFVADRQDRPRERELKDWMMLSFGGDFFFALAPVVLWPLWLLFLCLPADSFVVEKTKSSPPPIDYVGHEAEVVLPLTPTGRISIDGAHRDARAETGTIEAGARVLVCARSVGDELIVRQVDARNQEAVVTGSG